MTQRLLTTLPGASFTPPGPDYSAPVLRGFMQARFLSLEVPASALNEAVDGLLELYPDVPALGAPIGTGNETWGFNPSFKWASILSAWNSIPSTCVLLTQRMTDNDSMYQAPRRMGSQAATKAGVRNYAYLFTDPQVAIRPESPWLGGSSLYSTSIDYVR